MKIAGSKFWGIIAIALASLVIIVTGSVVWIAFQLTSSELDFIVRLLQAYIGPLLILFLLLLVVCIWSLESVFRNYIRPVPKITEQVNLINTSNLSYRLPPAGGADIRRLCERINEAAQRFQSLSQHVEERVQRARKDSEQEKNTLAAIVTELTEGVLICNPDGLILLYNSRAKSLLTGSPVDNDQSPKSDPAGSKRYIGLGRSVFGLINENLLRHVLDQITDKLQNNDPEVASYFVTPGVDNRLLRVEAVPVLRSPGRQFTGLILILYDITRQLETDSDLNLALQAVTRGFRASLAGIRSAIETIIDYPDMELQHLEKLKRIIHRESLSMGELLESNLSFDGQIGASQWPLTTMSAQDLTNLFQARALEKLNVQVQMAGNDQTLWIKVDSYSLLLVLLFVVDKLKFLTGRETLTCRLSDLDWYIGLDLMWPGSPIKIETLREWERTPVVFEKEGWSLTLREILEHLGSDFGSYASKRLEGTSYLRFFLPVAEDIEPRQGRSLAILPESRPEFYDFDLFGRAEQATEINNQLLTELTYTVFDMETTGLKPSEGDEILSIGAIRIVNGRLLGEERFEQLIDPLRSIPWESVQIHGIQPEMVIGQPVIGRVLPRFQQFAEETVLVAHNAAFDMRFLQMKEEQTAVYFNNPVLDTLLLSAIVHPAHEDHNLEAIAQRLGVRILGRHTAMGDAAVTGELFLKLLPLLSEKGIHRLKDALEASKQTYYARMKF
ncbi:MAG: exonuclease domain-containing protein [Desulfobacteraceae bacterium]|jgi:DNA polymerase-3 subunit epsilon|nr:exonuclease domain-containing protein [Desulfobacteraceae bacterium]